MKNLRKILTIFAMAGFIVMLFTLPVKAEENADEASAEELNRVMTILNDCDAKEFPENGSSTVQSYTAGESVWVIGETQDGWYKISYQGKDGYILKENIIELQVEIEGQGTVDLVAAGLDGELAAMEAEGKMLVEEVERQRTETRRSRIWTVVIVILIIGIFVTGIISTVKKEKDRENSDDDKKDTDKKSIGRKSNDKRSKAADREIDDFDYYIDDDEENIEKKATEKKDTDLIDLDLDDEE